LLVRILKWLTLALFAYIGAAFLAKPDEAAMWCKENWSGRRDSNPQPSAWEADALPLRHTRSGWEEDN
jgi:hypothetical protein